METANRSEARACFSALVAAAEKGRPTLVGRHGKPCAMVVPVADRARLYPVEQPNFADYLLPLPESCRLEGWADYGLRPILFKQTHLDDGCCRAALALSVQRSGCLCAPRRLNGQQALKPWLGGGWGIEQGGELLEFALVQAEKNLV